MERAKRKLLIGTALGALLVLVMATPAMGQEEPAAATQFVLDNLWIFLAGVLVFFMQAGFALVEAGLTRRKNVSNIMMKNMMDMSAGVLAFALVGYGIAFGGED
ncbi:MAG TPA: ammonium transporter, partial [Acidimicrobiia bacterium]